LKAVSLATLHNTTSLQYEVNSVGAGVKAETNRLKREKLVKKNLDIVPWNPGFSVLNPNGRVIPGDKETPKNKDFFQNLNAQAGWNLRRRFEVTHNAVTKGFPFDPETMISISSKIECLRELKTELSQPTYGNSSNTGKMLINKKPKGQKSPNLFDSVKIAYWPIFKNKVLI
jgi:hypothetical protein